MSKTFTANAKKVTFSDAKVGDRVWSLTEGWGVIINRYAPHTTYPLNVEFKGGCRRIYTLWGLLHINDLNPTLFWDEVKVEIPEKPLPQLEVDTKVWVWSGKEGNKIKRHFSHFENGKLHTFVHGKTSWTGETTTAWNNWELVD